ncbi:unnamed protein product [Amoebophrya sp. A120]|nr:unnamed protein product [Amoebophrya sp. A120]|eukprot:GSA120T00002298001.1
MQREESTSTTPRPFPTTDGKATQREWLEFLYDQLPHDQLPRDRDQPSSSIKRHCLFSQRWRWRCNSCTRGLPCVRGRCFLATSIRRCRLFFIIIYIGSSVTLTVSNYDSSTVFVFYSVLLKQSTSERVHSGRWL